MRAPEGTNRWFGIAIAFVIAFPIAGIIRVPFLAFALFVLVFTSLYPRRIILATDQALVVIKAGRWRFTPQTVLARLDIETQIGPLKTFWRYTVLNGRRLYVVPRTYAEVEAADADVDRLTARHGRQLRIGRAHAAPSSDRVGDGAALGAADEPGVLGRARPSV